MDSLADKILLMCYKAENLPNIVLLFVVSFAKAILTAALSL